MPTTKGFGPRHKKAIAYYLEEHPGVRLIAPAAFPQVTFLMPDGKQETKEIIHLVADYEQTRRQARRARSSSAN